MRSDDLQRPVMSPQFGVRDNHVNARVAQNVIHLVGLEEVVDGHDHRAGVQNAKQRRDEFRAVLQPQPHPVAGLNGEVLLELMRDEDGLVPQVRVGVLALAPEQGGFLRMLLNGFRESASQIHGAVILSRIVARRQGGVAGLARFSDGSFTAA